MLGAGSRREEGRGGSAERRGAPSRSNLLPRHSKEPGSGDARGPAELTPTRRGPTSVAEEALRLLLGGSRDHCPHQVVYEGNQDDQEKQYLCLPDREEPAGESGCGHREGKAGTGRNLAWLWRATGTLCSSRAAGMAPASPRE